MLGVLLLVLTGCSDDDSSAPRTVNVDGLARAFAPAASASSYRITQSNAQTFKVSALGINSTSELDTDKPAIVGEVTPTESHMRVDVSRLLGGATVADGVGFEMWTGPKEAILDTRDYAQLQDAEPDLDLGPFAPGIALIDLAALQALDGDFVQAVAGQGVADLEQMARRLPQVVDDVEQDGSTLTGTAIFADVIGAIGGDVENLARGVAGGIALNLEVDADALTDVYVDYYSQLETDVTIEVENDVVRSVGYRADLSGVFSYVFERADTLGIDVSSGEISAFEDAVLITEALITFELVSDLDLPPAPKPTEDRTDEWIAFLRNAGL
jgi:hypothetical protein